MRWDTREKRLAGISIQGGLKGMSPQILSDFEECLFKQNWLSRQPGSSPVGDSEGPGEGLQQTRGKVSN
jgi:hypothetical protein